MLILVFCNGTYGSIRSNPVKALIATPIEAWYATGAQKRECGWAHTLSLLPGALVPALRFGASDCRCSSHLVHFAAPPNAASFAHGVGAPISLEKLDA